MEILKQLNSIIIDLATNPYITLVGFLVGIIGFLYALRDRKIKELAYRLASINIIKNSKKRFPLLNITYDKKNLENFTVTRVSIINVGSDVIRYGDIAQSDPLTICVDPIENSEILEYDVMFTDDKVNQFTIEKLDFTKLVIKFDFVEPNDAAIIQILHTGIDVKVTGTVIGAKKPFSSSGNISTATSMAYILRSTLKSPRVFTLIFSTILLGLFAVPAYISFNSANYLVGILCLIPSIFFLYGILVALFRKRSPVKEALLRESMRSMLSQAADFQDDFEKKS